MGELERAKGGYDATYKAVLRPHLLLKGPVAAAPMKAPRIYNEMKFEERCCHQGRNELLDGGIDIVPYTTRRIGISKDLAISKHIRTGLILEGNRAWQEIHRR